MKICSTCKKEKKFVFFNKDKKVSDGFSRICKTCRKEARIKYREVTSEYNKYYAEINKEKIIEKSKRWYLKNIDYKKEYDKRYCKNNKEYIAKRKIAYTFKNKEHIREQRAEHRKAIKDEISKYNKKYFSSEQGKASRALINGNRRALIKGGSITQKDIIEAKKAKVCYWCECELDKNNIQIDHYMPLSRGGLHDKSNIVASCKRCNLRKHNKLPTEFRKILILEKRIQNAV